MARIEHSAEINRPMEDVFRYLTEVTNLPEWQSGVLEARSNGPLAEGSTITELRKFLGMRAESTLEVTKYQPSSLFQLRVVDGPVPLEVSHQLKATDGGTQLRVVLQGEPGGFVKVAGPLVMRTVRREVEFDLATLKDLLETRH